jgi:hypothetical protein
MQRPWTRGVTTAGETKRWATQQSLRRQTATMACHFTAGHCANALIPTLGLDASTSAVPFKCSLLDALGTSLTSSSTTSSSYASPSHGSLCLLHRCQICELRGEAPRMPPGQLEQNKSSCHVWTSGAGGPLRIGARTQGAANRVAPGTFSVVTLRGPAPGGALNAPSLMAATALALAPCPVIHLQRIHNFLCSMLIFTPFA